MRTPKACNLPADDLSDSAQDTSGHHAPQPCTVDDSFEHPSVSPDDDTPRHEILQQAAEWFAILNDDRANASAHTGFTQWLAQHPAHQEAWQQVEQISECFHHAQQHAGAEVIEKTRQQAHHKRISRRRIIQKTGLLSVLAWLTWRYTPLAEYTGDYRHTLLADHATAKGSTREVALLDGGQLWLNTASAVNIDYQPSVRHIALLSGEILIQTARDTQQRPFVVSTNQGRLRALGTRFSVQQTREHTTLAVYRGAVEITTTRHKTATIEAGQQVVFTEHTIAPVHLAERAREAWAQGLIVADNISLAQLMAQLQRYQYGYIGVDPSIATIKVMGVYPLNNLEQTLAMLEAALPIHINKRLPWWVTLEPAL